MADDQPTHERWLPVVGYEGLYEVSDHGRVRSVDRTIVGSDGVRQRHSGQMLVQGTNSTCEHRLVKLRSGHQRRVARYVHRLVLEAFVGPCPEGHEVCHNDGDPTNNHVSNLRYGTVSDNRYDSVRHGTHVEARKTHCPRGHVLDDPNLVPSLKVRGCRSCLACSRAHSYWRTHPYLDRWEVADRYYRQIMAV